MEDLWSDVVSEFKAGVSESRSVCGVQFLSDMPVEPEELSREGAKEGSWSVGDRMEFLVAWPTGGDSYPASSMTFYPPSWTSRR